MAIHEVTKPNVPVLYESKKARVPVRYGVPRTDETEACKQATDYALRRNQSQPISDSPELTTEELKSARASALAYAARINQRYSKHDGK